MLLQNESKFGFHEAQSRIFQELALKSPVCDQTGPWKSAEALSEHGLAFSQDKWTLNRLQTIEIELADERLHSGLCRKRKTQQEHPGTFPGRNSEEPF